MRRRKWLCTSQFFANVYLDPLDQMVSRELRPGCYVRYVDDFAIFGDSKADLAAMRARVEECLEPLRLCIHERKSRVYRSSEGFAFLGWTIFPSSRRLARQNVVRFRRRLRGMQREYAEGNLDWNRLRAKVAAWNGHAAHGDTWKLRECLFDQFPFAAGSAVKGVAGRVLEQQSEEPALVLPEQQ